ncbi:MAG: glycosyltransferase family 25 protein [Thermoguttaceae bacterium]|nr:glycosyltransferase family 25 protein [Thermoguttaceae bacterium]
MISPNKIIVISLPQRADRRKQFAESFASTGLDWQIETVPAIYGKALDMPKIIGTIGPGGYGCWCSHLLVLLRAISEGWENYLLLEDDAIFTPEFKKVFTRAAQELPEDWDQLYLGFQALNQNQAKFERYSSHLLRVGDAHRAHAYMLNKRAYSVYLKHLFDIADKPQVYHIDHWFGQLHLAREEGRRVVNVFATYPQIVNQSAGKSDINGADNQERSWSIARGDILRTSQYTDAELVSCGYGTLGVGGLMGFDGQRVRTGTGHSDTFFFSAHAPSEIILRNKVDIDLTPIINKTGGPRGVTVTAYVDGREVGKLTKAGQVGSPVRLAAGGEYRCAFSVDGDSFGCHTIWAVDEQPVETVEIMSCSACGNNCPGCNQAGFIRTFPSYEYTTKDAEALCQALVKYNRVLKLCLIGGDPALWKQAEEVAEVFNACPNIVDTWAVTSVCTEKNITRLQDLFGKVILSMRPANREIVKRRPLWLRDVEIWKMTAHYMPHTADPVEGVRCICARRLIIGSAVYPCVMSRALEIDGDWSGDLEPITLDEFFLGGYKEKPLGSFAACHGCTNNEYYRKVCQTAET